MVYYTLKGNSKKHGEIIKAEFDIFALQHKGQRVDYKGTTAGQRHSNKISSLIPNEDNIFLKPKDMTERM